MTDEEIVKAKWPKAHCAPYAAPVYPRLYCIRMKVTEWAETLGEGHTPEAAWQSAASRIQRDPIEQEGSK